MYAWNLNLAQSGYQVSNFWLNHFGDWAPCVSFSEEHMLLEPDFNYTFQMKLSKVKSSLERKA